MPLATAIITDPQENGTRTLAAIGMMVLAMFILCGMDTLGKVLAQHIPVTQVVWGRYFFQFALLLLAFPWLGWRGLVATARPGTQIARGLLLAVGTLCLFMALATVPLADAYAINFTSPFFVTILSIPLLGERVGRLRWSAIAIGFIGVLVVIRPGLSGFDPLLLLPMITAACFALYQVLTRMISGLPTERPLSMLFHIAVVGAAAQSVLVAFTWQPIPLVGWIGLTGMGALSIAGHLILIRALGMASAVVLSPFAYTQIIWALLFGYFLFGDIPDIWMIIGCIIIVGSGLFVFYREAVRRRQSA